MQKFWFVVHPLDFILVTNQTELDVVIQAFVRVEIFIVLKEQFSQKCRFIKIRIFFKNIPIFPYSELVSVSNNASAR